MDRLDAMRAFVYVVELGGFSRAAEALGVSKGHVSTAVARLEANLGTRLLHRTTRRVEPSLDGRRVHERCRRLLAEADELGAMFQHGAALTGRLRVDMPSGIAQDLVLPRLDGFLARHPRLEIELGSNDRRVDLVGEGFDCVLRVGTVEDGSLVARVLGCIPVLTCASPDYLRRHGTPHTLEDLDRHRLIHFAGRFGAAPDGFEYFDGERYRERPMQGSLTVDSAGAYLAACVAGLGLIQAPVLGKQAWITRGALVEVLPEFRAAPMPVSLLYAHRRGLPRRVAAFMAWIGELLAPHLEPWPARSP